MQITISISLDAPLAHPEPSCNTFVLNCFSFQVSIVQPLLTSFYLHFLLTSLIIFYFTFWPFILCKWRFYQWYFFFFTLFSFSFWLLLSLCFLFCSSFDDLTIKELSLQCCCWWSFFFSAFTNSMNIIFSDSGFMHAH